MDMKLALHSAISTWDEFIAFETLWALPRQSTAKLARVFEKNNLRPTQVLEDLSASDLALGNEIEELRELIAQALQNSASGFSISFRDAEQFPSSAQAAKLPLPFVYYKGDISLAEESVESSVSIVGSRAASSDDKATAFRLAQVIVREGGLRIVSGLARGIDTAALTGAVEAGGRVIGVIGTSINKSYPKENASLQEEIAKNHLLMSHVPIYRGSKEGRMGRTRFPERNRIMSAISKATIIVAAGETSGTLTQARAAISQDRKLIIWGSCFDNPDLTWPMRFLSQGAIRVDSINDVLVALGI